MMYISANLVIILLMSLDTSQVVESKKPNYHVGPSSMSKSGEEKHLGSRFRRAKDSFGDNFRLDEVQCTLGNDTFKLSERWNSLRYHHQHPNDVKQINLNFKSAAAPPANPLNTKNFQAISPNSQQQQQYPPPPDTCILGNDTFRLGERWNPKLPAFGVQVCVLCECVLRKRKNYYEPKVTCKKMADQCPILDHCPHGKKLVVPVGQCCKSCQDSTTVDTPTA